jgi:hypothetical protein
MKQRLWLQNDEQNDKVIYDVFMISWSWKVWCVSAIKVGFQIVGIKPGVIGIGKIKN